MNLFDSYLTKINVKSGDLQLVALGSLCIAAKYEEIYAPELRDYYYVSANTYTKERIIKMEYDILSTLNFDVLYVSPLIFLRRYHQITQSAFKSLFLAQFILEFSLMDEQQQQQYLTQHFIQHPQIGRTWCNSTFFNGCIY